MFDALFEWILLIYNYFLSFPGSYYVVNYVKKSYQNDPVNIAIEALLVFLSIRYLTTITYSLDKYTIPYTEQEVEQLCDDWQPEPLISNDVPALQQVNLDSSHLVNGPYGSIIEIDSKKLLNVSSTNALGIINHPLIKKLAAETVDLYGVGTCGPRGFYGTLDLHLDLESEIAKCVGVESAIIYSQSSSTLSSVIPAFSKVGDILVVDSGCQFSLQKGVELSKSIFFHFNHNDMHDLESILRDIELRFNSNPKKPRCRKFIIVEGLYTNYGDICPLPKLMELKKKYKYRLMLDESLSFGSIGPSGKGVIDYYGIDPNEVDIIMGSLAHHIGASGGFCAGSSAMIDYQRLNGKAYCFSASLPGFLTNSARFGIAFLDQYGSAIMPKLERNIINIYQQLKKVKSFLIETGPSPCMHLYLNSTGQSSWLNEAKILDEISNFISKKGVFISRAKYLDSAEWLPLKPSLRLNVSSTHTESEINNIVTALSQAAQLCLK